MTRTWGLFWNAFAILLTEFVLLLTTPRLPYGWACMGVVFVAVRAIIIGVKGTGNMRWELVADGCVLLFMTGVALAAYAHTFPYEGYALCAILLAAAMLALVHALGWAIYAREEVKTPTSRFLSNFAYLSLVGIAVYLGPLRTVGETTVLNWYGIAAAVCAVLGHLAVPMVFNALGLAGFLLFVWICSPEL